MITRRDASFLDQRHQARELADECLATADVCRIPHEFMDGVTAVAMDELYCVGDFLSYEGQLNLRYQIWVENPKAPRLLKNPGSGVGEGEECSTEACDYRQRKAHPIKAGSPGDTALACDDVLLQVVTNLKAQVTNPGSSASDDPMLSRPARRVRAGGEHRNRCRCQLGPVRRKLPSGMYEDWNNGPSPSQRRHTRQVKMTARILIFVSVLSGSR